MATLTVSEIINIGRVSTYLSKVDIQKKELRNIPYFDQDLPALIAMETDFLNWWYVLNPSDTTLQEVANGLYALCGVYAPQALNILNNGGGIVIDPATGQPNNISFQYIEFLVSSGMSAPYTTYIIEVANIINGSVKVFVDGVFIYTSEANALNVSIVYTAANVTITFNSSLAPTSTVGINYAKTI